MLMLCAHAANAGTLTAPNVVTISPSLVTSGQPTAASLKSLGSDGFAAVIYLAPTNSVDAIAGEADMVRAQGMEW
ncbi:MAG: hypothetical protein H7255_01495, partial [Ramlibacter sp.]|nr:hypothetical protein [Ramlibacter sp.]